MVFGAVIYVAAAGAFWGAVLAQPETVKGLVKKDKSTWQVPIVAKQPNENKPTKVLGSYPELNLDTLARPLKANQARRPFSQFLSGKVTGMPQKVTGIPHQILQRVAQRQTSTAKPLEEKKLDRQFGLAQDQTTTAKPRLIQRPSYNSALAAEADADEKPTQGKYFKNLKALALLYSVVLTPFRFHK